ncbi:peptidase S8/S53 domain-containing protein, partial [Mycena olivaceomarginata]
PNANKQLLAGIHPQLRATPSLNAPSLGRVFLAVLGVIPICLASAPPGDYVVHEPRTMPARRWVKRDRVPGDHTGSMTIALATSTADTTSSWKRERMTRIRSSHPDSPKYGQHYTQTEIVEMFSPTSEAVVAFHNWLHDFGVLTDRITFSRDRTRIVVNSYVSQAEDLLRAEYHMFEHRDTGRVEAGKARFGDSLGNELERRGLKPPGPPRKQNMTNDQLKKCITPTLTHCDEFITPSCIKAMYNITDNTCVGDPRNRLGIFEFGDFYSQASLKEFFATFGIILQRSRNGDGIRSRLANQARRTGERPYPEQVSGSLGPSAYSHPLQCGTTKPPNVLSISYGEQEFDLPKSYQKRQCSEFLKLGLVGTTVVVASGDSGVAARGYDAGNASGCLGTGQVFNPDYPVTCPYITAVGATYLPSGASAEADEEIAVTAFPTGGGFSNIYKRPRWQKVAVNTYLIDHKPSYELYDFDPDYETGPAGEGYDCKGGIFNKGGRGYLDIYYIDSIPD